MGDDNAQVTAPVSDHQASSSGSQPKQKKKKEYTRIEPTTPEQLAQEDLMNNCAVKTVVSGVMGSFLGAAFGVFMGAMDTATPAMDGAAAGAEKQTTGQVIRQMLKTTGQRSISYAKGFGAVGALFAGSECVIEKIRAKHDIYNAVYAGCAAGGLLASSAGPKAMCAGCVTFAAFSAFIDKMLDHD
ncbi:g6674 [Coccomyxa elongata]